MIERRQYSRILTEQPARILCNYRSVLACTIRDISAGGACLELDPVLPIPDQFDLIPDRRDNSHACRVVWRFGERVGVAFN
jgi:c-di-GMP-binding flagellar brake protein YcgR